MGHASVKGLKHSCTGIDDFNDANPDSCKICARANIKKKPFPHHSDTRSDQLIFRVHSDICGPLPNAIGGFRYFILFIDDKSRWIFVYFMKQRDEALSHFKTFKKAVEVFTGLKVVHLRVDNAKEYTEGPFREFMESEGGHYEPTIPYSPSQNGVAERANYTLASMARAMLIDSNLSDFLWPAAIAAAVHIKNRLPHSSLPPNSSPYFEWFGDLPDLSHLRPFGCPVTVRIPIEKPPKFAPRGEDGIFVGYPTNAKGYLVWFPHRRRILPRRDIIFHDVPKKLEKVKDSSELIALWQDILDRDDVTTPTQVLGAPL